MEFGVELELFLAFFRVVQVCQRQLSFFVITTYTLNVKTYQFTTPCKSDEVTHPKQNKSFFLG